MHYTVTNAFLLHATFQFSFSIKERLTGVNLEIFVITDLTMSTVNWSKISLKVTAPNYAPCVKEFHISVAQLLAVSHY